MNDTGSSTQRVIPHDVGAERAILGAVLLHPDSLGRAQESGLVEDAFYREPHRLLFRVFSELDRDHKAIDLVTVAGRLESIGKLESIGGYSYLAGLPASTPSVANLGHYVQVVLDKSQLRTLLTRAAEITEDVFAGEKPAEEIIDAAEKAIFEIGEVKLGKTLVPLGGIVEHVYETIRARAEAPDDVTGLPTGFRDLDHKLGGLQPTDLIILAARPAMGKTACALNMVCRTALDSNANVAVFSLEMGSEQLAGRLLASESRVLAHRMKTGRLHQDDWPMLIEASERLHAAPIFLDDTPALTLASMWSKCRRLKSERGLDLVVIDYLQLMKGTGKEGSREQEISGISRGLKGLAKEFNIPVIALSQLNRGVEQRADKRPMMSDLRESGAIEQDADQIMFLYRDEVYNENTELKGIAEVLVRKNRHGDIGDVKLFWRGEYLRFENLARDEFA
ncbi:MAG: replicative DNA helicase [Deltaproteobacteria bacterium]|nr:replicative DNA helicase [Deltaproteobacteria bacterium]